MKNKKLRSPYQIAVIPLKIEHLDRHDLIERDADCTVDRRADAMAHFLVQRVILCLDRVLLLLHLVRHFVVKTYLIGSKYNEIRLKMRFLISTRKEGLNMLREEGKDRRGGFLGSAYFTLIKAETLRAL